jgi:hypothetical protein
MAAPRPFTASPNRRHHQVSVSGRTYARLDQVARARGVTISSIIDEAFAKAEGVPPPPPRARAKRHLR